MSKRMCVKFDSKSIEISEAMAKKASVPFSPEFSEMVEVTRALPDFKVVVKKKPPVKQTHLCGLTYEFMRQHIMDHADSERLEEFEKLRSYGANYCDIRNWFLSLFLEIAEFNKAA